MKKLFVIQNFDKIAEEENKNLLTNKNKIDKEKKNRNTHIEYIKSFCESEKANELFKNNDDFKKLNEFIKK